MNSNLYKRIKMKRWIKRSKKENREKDKEEGGVQK